jgi:hypothetical protein
VPPNLHWLSEIISTLRLRYKALNLDLHYEAAWTDSWSHRRCRHQHRTLIEAAKCAMPNGAGWYVFAVNGGTPRQLTDAEDKIVDEFRFGAQDLGSRT